MKKSARRVSVGAYFCNSRSLYKVSAAAKEGKGEILKLSGKVVERERSSDTV